MAFTKSQAEQLFLQFTNRTQGIYLSARFIDSKGMESIITQANKRIKGYTSLETSLPNDIFYSKVRSLFNSLKSSPPDTQLFEGPFEYNGKLTFLVGTPVLDPEIGGFTGIMVLHGDLTDFTDHLSKYVIYEKHTAAAYGLDGTSLFNPGSGDQISGAAYEVSDLVKMARRQSRSLR